MTSTPGPLPAFGASTSRGISAAMLLARPDDAAYALDIPELEGARRVVGIKGVELDGLGGLPVEDLDQHLAGARADDDTVAATRLRGGRDHDDVAVAVKRQHGVAGDFERIGTVVPASHELHRVPAVPGRQTRAVEKPTRAGARQPEQRHRRAPRGSLCTAVVHELIKTFARRLEHLGDTFGGGPALAPVLADALGAVEGRGVEAGNTCEPRRAEVMTFGEGVDGVPDGAVCEHAG